MEDKNNQNDKYWWSAGLGLFARLSAWVVGPILLAILVGKKLDAKYETEPWLFLLLVGFAFVISISAIVIIGLREFKTIDPGKEDKK